jgi:hypothetical protein
MPLLLANPACSAWPLGHGGRVSEPGAGDGRAAQPAHCTYDVMLVGMEPAALEVRAHCAGFTPQAFVANDIQSGAHTRSLDGPPPTRQPDGRHTWSASGARPSVRYRVELEALAGIAEHFDAAERIGASIITPASTFLLTPQPAPPGTRVSVRFQAPPGAAVATALRRRRENEFELSVPEIRVASYCVFGSFQRKEYVFAGQRGGRATLQVVALDGRLDLAESTLERWILQSAGAISEFWAGFPVERALLIVIPVRGRDKVLFGKVLPESAPGIVVLVGEHATERSLFDDWILIHELFHLGSPSFANEGKWLDEGLATYYEPIIRARAGWYSERELWNEFVRAMPQGLTAVTREGLENARSYRGIYWGGAILVLRADLDARVRSGGRLGLEHGLRAALQAGANASEVWPLERAIETLDTATGGSSLAELASRHARHGSELDLEALWTTLGVQRHGSGALLSADPDRARLRRALIYGGPPDRNRPRARD